MSEEDFLKRWSRRKREVAKTEERVPPQAETSDAGTPPQQIAADQSADTPQAAFDPASLPPIESITAISDVTAFLRAGVPAELTRAALRRVWTADPAIRNFVGLAENAWDFTDPNAMPGFGPLESTDEVRRMIARIVDSIGEAARPANAEGSAESAETSQNLSDSSAVSSENREPERPAQVVSALDQDGDAPAEILRNQVLLQGNKEDVAMQRDVTEAAVEPKQSSRRAHGGALPD